MFSPHFLIFIINKIGGILHTAVKEKKVSCLKCSFMIKEMNGNEYVYKCQAHALKRIKVDTEIKCIRYKKREKNKKVILTNNFQKYFDTEPLKNLIMERKEK